MEYRLASLNKACLLIFEEARGDVHGSSKVVWASYSHFGAGDPHAQCHSANC